MGAREQEISPSQVGPVEEYKTLRLEMERSKQYVFERPLLILGIAAAGSQAIKEEAAMLLLIIVTGLLLFNFQFTVNRLQSAARIAAYIQLELESHSHGRWIGWETCLREYRRWLCTFTEEKRGEIQKNIDERAIRDGLMYYKSICVLHLGLISFCLAVALGNTFIEKSLIWLAGTSLIAALAIWFFIRLYQFRPSRMLASVERNRAIWMCVFQKMIDDKIK